MDTGNAAVSFEEMTFYRGERTIFDRLTVQIPKGKITAILGPSGTGKTTLLKLIGGLAKPSKGKVHVLDKSVTQLKYNELFELRKRMGLLFQSGALFTGLNAFDNVAFPLREHTRLSEALITDIVLMKLEAVGLRGARSLMPSELSGGMARRVALARSIILDPEILMYDEPFTGQDPISMGVLLKLIRALNDALGLTSIVVTHDVNEILQVADYVIILSGGGVIGQGTPHEIKNHHSDMVSQFVNGNPDGPVSFHYPSASLQNDFLLERRKIHD